MSGDFVVGFLTSEWMYDEVRSGDSGGEGQMYSRRGGYDRFVVLQAGEAVERVTEPLGLLMKQPPKKVLLNPRYSMRQCQVTL